MPTSNQTQIFFDFGVSTYSVNGFGAGGTIAAGNSATFHAIGLNFTYSSAGSNSNFDSSDSGMLNVRGTDTMMLTLGNDSHTFSNLTLDFGIVYGDASITFLNSTGATVAQYTAADILADGSLHHSGSFSGIRFKSSLLMNIDTMTMSVNCFLTGTMIDTPTGAKAVETLNIGDEICTAKGGVTTIAWHGEQDMSPRFQNPQTVYPISLTANAFGAGYPLQDLYLSSDHAIGIDGQLINAGALVNGTTIFQKDIGLENFTYHHLETEKHELILAEGLPVETFVDYSDRNEFKATGDDRLGVLIPEMPLPRLSASRLVNSKLRTILSVNQAMAA